MIVVIVGGVFGGAWRGRREDHILFLIILVLMYMWIGGEVPKYIPHINPPTAKSTDHLWNAVGVDIAAGNCDRGGEIPSIRIRKYRVMHARQKEKFVKFGKARR